MAIQIVHTFAPGTTSATVDIRPGDCFLLLFSDFVDDYDARNCLQIGEHAYVSSWDPSIYTGNWVSRLLGDLCYLQVTRFTPGPHTITFKNVGNMNVGSNVPLAWGLVLRGASPTGIVGVGVETTVISKNGPTTFETTFPVSVVSPMPSAILLSRSLASVDGYRVWCRLNSAPNGTTVFTFPAQYVFGNQEVSDGPWQVQPFTSTTTVNVADCTFGFYEPQSNVIVDRITNNFWVFYEGDYDEGGGGEDDEITGVTQVAGYIEAVADDSGSGGSGGPNATSVTQVSSYIEAVADDGSGGSGGPNATSVTQVSSYIEAIGIFGDGDPNATGVTQIGGYVEAVAEGSADATGITQIGAYIEAVVDPNYSATLVRISQAFVLVEARRVKRLPYLPDAGDIPSRLPEYQQAPPVPFNPLDLPEVATPTVSMQPLPQKGPVPFGPIQWISMPAPTVSMQPLPENAPSQQDYALPGSQSNILAITETRISRSMLVDALAATFDAQSTVVKGAAVGPNLALVNGMPAPTTETSPIAGRTATYTNIGRASMAIYAPEAQTPNAQKASSATDATPTIVSTPAKPITRINLIYPLLGSGSLASDLTIALDEIGYRKTIADVLDAIMQSTVTIGYEEGTAPETINLYVIPATINAATLDGLTVQELYLIGSTEAQVLRYNESAGQWRTVSEPLDFKGLNLATDETPDQHGGFRYNPLTKHLEMLVEVA